MTQQAGRPEDVDLATVATPQRRRAWSRWVERSFPGLQVARMAATPGRGKRVQLGPARLWRIDAPSQLVVRTSNARRPAGDDLIASLQVHGTSVVTHETQRHRSAAGSVMLSDNRHANFEIACETAATHLILELPRSLVSARHAQLPASKPRLVEPDDAGVVLLSNAMLATFEAAPRFDAAQARIAVEVLTLLIGMPSGLAADADPRLWRLQRALADIDARLTDPQLDAASIAERQHISRRRLDEIFLAELQQTVAARIRVRRLERAAATLSDEESIISVAYKVGFEDAANFTRAFKRHFGVTPREYRRAQLHKRQL